jgi:YfiH family protein
VYGQGELNLGFTADDDPEAVTENRRRLVEAAGGGELVTLRQVHSTQVMAVDGADEARRMMPHGRAGCEGDGLLTAAAGLLLGVFVADCVPVLVVDTRRRLVGACHAGWRGTAAGMAGIGVRALEALGGRVEDIVAAVGPSIGPCCYAVGEEVRSRFAAGDLFAQRDDAMYLDLWEANRRQLLAAGIAAERVSVVEECTACARVGGRRKYFSHRAEKGFTGRAMGVVGVREE